MKKLMCKTTFAVCYVLLLAASSHAATPVPKQIKIIVPFSAGASNDSIARVIAPQLGEKLKTSVIVENRAGAAGVIGSDYVAKAAKDGSVLLLNSSTFVTSAATQPTLPYDAIKSFVPIAMIGQGPLVVAVSSEKPYQSLGELLEAARAHPKTLNYGSAGVGSLAHLASTLLNDAAKVDITHVPYKGSANAAADLAGGRIDFMLANYSSMASLLPTGKVRLVATTAPGKHQAFPQLPPAAQTVPGYDVDIWVGVFAPAGTPEDLVKVLNRSLVEISRSRQLTALLDMDGTVPSDMSSAEFASRVVQDLGRWKALASQHGITAN
ncbi:ABC transporter substrate-binding protein [Pollutimonas nitritireducens]|uniref:ABC transporter substrate-binding protein n=2 Tax=Pollutimonas nitritireducens TaxID=2045209 RepID=A0A2N4UI96_9BURK|nr:ABC transporter substrate-binding protein [Pollutimonas nitritireducens]